MTWVRVTPRFPCPVCGKVDWCCVSKDGEVVQCMRVQSERELPLGWLHRMNEPIPEAKINPDERAKTPRMAPEVVYRIAMQAFNHREAPASRRHLADELGVSVESLECLQVGQGIDSYGRRYASFPARNGREAIIGITRRYPNGKKLTLKGTSNSGIFYALPWQPTSTVYILEGPTDVAAAFDRGIPAIGRPSNVGGIKAILGLLRRCPARRLIVAGENDRKPERIGTHPQCPDNCQGCPWCWPGKYGAKKVAASLGRALKRQVTTLMPPPQFKDFREWCNSKEFPL